MGEFGLSRRTRADIPPGRPSAVQLRPRTEAVARKFYKFSCAIGKRGLTSAGIFDSSGRLVRVLWTTKEATEAGPLEGKWNGKDGNGKFAPPGEYAWKMVVNRSKYENVGTIGNSGQPPTTSGHVPVFLEGVAVDAKDGIYTVHGWDEAHFSAIKWSQEDGRAEFNTGNAVNEALLRSIAVEPDGSYAYVTVHRDMSDRAKTKFSHLANKAGSWEEDLEG